MTVEDLLPEGQRLANSPEVRKEYAERRAERERIWKANRLTIGQLKEIIKDLPDSMTLVLDDGEYDYEPQGAHVGHLNRPDEEQLILDI